jgi:N-acetylmuramoyl-L-alanine amidase
LGVFLLLPAAVRGAALVSFSARVQEELRIADTELVERQGVAYVSLSSLVRQIGGGCTVTPDRVQVDLVAKTAWLKPNTAQVTASLGDFTLRHPIVKEGNDVRIALGDVASFFDKAFLLVIRQDAEPAVPQTDSVPAPGAVSPAAPEPSRGISRPVEVVIVDPGHGGHDTGCEGPAGLKESALSLALAQKVRHALEQGSPLKALLTRDTDRDATRNERITFANSHKGDLIVSLHAGAGFAQSAAGFESFCANAGNPARIGGEYAEKSLAAADKVAGALAEFTGSANRGVHQAPCAVLSDVAMPGFLIEVGFLTNPAEETLLQTEAFQDKIAQGIAAGIKRYVDAVVGGGATP